MPPRRPNPILALAGIYIIAILAISVLTPRLFLMQAKGPVEALALSRLQVGAMVSAIWGPFRDLVEACWWTLACGFLARNLAQPNDRTELFLVAIVAQVASLVASAATSVLVLWQSPLARNLGASLADGARSGDMSATLVGLLTFVLSPEMLVWAAFMAWGLIRNMRWLPRWGVFTAISLELFRAVVAFGWGRLAV